MADRRFRWRLLLGIGLGLALSLTVVWQVGKRLLDVDQYRGLAETELERWTGLPVRIRRLDLALRPIPALTAFDVSIGEDELRAVAARIDMLPVLGALWERRLEISRIDLGRLQLTLPSDASRLQTHWDALVQRIEVASQPAASATASVWSSLLGGFAVHRVLAEDVDVLSSEGGDPWIHTSVRVSGLADAEVDVDLDARLAAFGTRVTGRLRVPQSATKDRDLQGDFELRADWPGDLSAVPTALRSRLVARTVLRTNSENHLRLEIDGTVEPQVPGALSGEVSGELRLADGALSGDFAADGPELSLRGSARSADDGVTELRIDSLDAGRAGVLALLEWLGTEFVELSVPEAGSLALREVALGFGPEGGAPVLRSGSLSARGLEAGFAGRPVARDVELDAEVAEGGIAIRTLRGGPFDLVGDLRFEPDWSQLELALRGDVALTPALLESLGASGLENVSGRIRLEELRQAFPATAARAALPVLRARVRDATARLVGDGWSDELSGIDLRIATAGTELRVEGRARSRALGDVDASATWTSGTREARGRVAIDPSAGLGVGTAALWEVLAPLLHAWGPAGVAVAASWTEDPAAGTSLRLERTASPSLSAQLALHPDRSDVLGDVNLDAQLPAQLFEGRLPGDLEAEGDAGLRFTRDPAGKTFSMDADLGPLALRSGRFVEKRAGEVLRVKLTGDVETQGLRPRRLVVASANASLPLEWRDERWVAPALDVDLAAWSFLLTEGAAVSGRLRGNVATNPLDARLELTGVGLRLSPDLAIDAADGTIVLDGHGGWSVRELRMQGAGSDVLIDAAMSDEQIGGRVAGAALDVDLVRALVTEVRALLPEPEQGAAPMRGTLALKLDRVRIGRSEARDLATEIHFDGEDMHVPAFDVATYEGRVSGALDLVGQPAGPRRLDLKLDIAAVTGRFLDDFFFEEAPRGIRGTFSGTLVFSAPLADDVKAMLAAGDGRLAWTARDGSFGKLGFATRITTALRASQALRLRLPAMKDEGLVFDTVSADFPMEQGRLRIAPFELDTTSYAITAEGILDFAQDRSDVPIEVNATKGLTGFIDMIPVAGDALQIVNVRLHATGSPYDLTVSMASFKDQIVRASVAGPKSLIKRVRDAVALAKRVNGKATEPAGASVPDTAAPGAGAEPSGEGAAAPEAAAPVEDAALPQPEVAPAEVRPVEESEGSSSDPIADDLNLEP